MNARVARKNAVVAALESEFIISHLFGCEIANGWEYNARRRGVDASMRGLWIVGCEWMARQAVARPRAAPRHAVDPGPEHQ